MKKEMNYRAHYLSKTNEELLTEYLESFSGDGEDGYYSDDCLLRLRAMGALLSDRLIAVGFITKTIQELLHGIR